MGPADLFAGVMLCPSRQRHYSAEEAAIANPGPAQSKRPDEMTTLDVRRPNGRTWNRGPLAMTQALRSRRPVVEIARKAAARSATETFISLSDCADSLAIGEHVAYWAVRIEACRLNCFAIIGRKNV